MPKRTRVLVLPAHSEIGHTIRDALFLSPHFELVGGSSARDDPGRLYPEFVPNLPDASSNEFITAVEHVVSKYSVDRIFPSHDLVLDATVDSSLAKISVGSPSETIRVTRSKLETLRRVVSIVPTPRVYDEDEQRCPFPLFAKPDRGFASRGSTVVRSRDEIDSLRRRLAASTPILLTDYLPGREWTVDCFTDRHGRVQYVGPRLRTQIRRGISADTAFDWSLEPEFLLWAERLSATLGLRGAWFFQAREDEDGCPKLLEVGPRIAGSSNLNRAVGVNLPALALLDSIGEDVAVKPQRRGARLTRRLTTDIDLEVSFDALFIDFDDCIMIRELPNTDALSLIHLCVALKKRVVLVTRHKGDIVAALKRLRIHQLFDDVVHIRDRFASKADHVRFTKSPIFIDDSFAERSDVSTRLGIPTFGPEVIGALVARLASESHVSRGQ